MTEQNNANRYRVYRGIYPSLQHLDYRLYRNSVPPRPLVTDLSHKPLFDDSTIPDSQKVRFELPYLVEIFNSWTEQYRHLANVLSLQTLLSIPAGGKTKVHMQYRHDGRLYESHPRLLALACIGGKTHYSLQIPLSNNGYVYRIIKPKDVAQEGITLHQGPSHPSGIGESVELNAEGAAGLGAFADFARDWFGCKPEDLQQSVFYNGLYNRVDVVFTRENHPISGNKVTLEICFEPGWALFEFTPHSFRVTQEYIDAGK